MRTLPLGRFDGRPSPQLETLLGQGLDARRFTDLSALTPDTLITPADRVQPLTGPWRILVTGVDDETTASRSSLPGASWLVHRVVGIRWGGTSPACALTIRFTHGGPFVPVDRCLDTSSTTSWSLWTHLWRPDYPGRYHIALRSGDPNVRARRLDLFFYTRDVDIDRV